MVIILLTEGYFYEKQGEKTRCLLCPHHCTIAPDKFGICSVRTNTDGILQTINYGEVTSLALDPIEKKPLYHFHPGKNILSVGTFGCNFSCSFCQNYTIAHKRARSERLSPERLIEVCRKAENNIGIAFTYNEPTIWYEYVYETARKLKEQYPEYKIVLVTNGYIAREPLVQLLSYVDGMNIDLKSFQKDYYKEICGGDLEAVLETISEAVGKCHVEITTLLVNGLNDSPEEIEKLAQFLGSLDKNIPLHLSRYFPSYKLALPPTEVEKMVTGKEVAQRYLSYVYLGNVANFDNSTFCPQCGRLLIKRRSYFTQIFMSNPICPDCGFDTKIVI